MTRALNIAISLLLGAASAAWAQSDYHLTQDPARQIYLNSAFAHGHRHGYEEGFHAGDEDYQLRRSPSTQQKLPRDKGYQASFGDKKAYLSGFESGFRAGYADSYSGGMYRSMKAPVWPVAMTATDSAAGRSREFDLGMAAGYKAGFSGKAHFSDEHEVVDWATWQCSQEKHAESFCSGYGTGYVMGRDDSQSVATLEKSIPTNLAKNALH